jgi:hypothetical protein
MELFAASSPRFQRRFIATLQEIRHSRLQLEALYEEAHASLIEP